MTDFNAITKALNIVDHDSHFNRTALIVVSLATFLQSTLAAIFADTMHPGWLFLSSVIVLFLYGIDIRRLYKARVSALLPVIAGNKAKPPNITMSVFGSFYSTVHCSALALAFIFFVISSYRLILDIDFIKENKLYENCISYAKDPIRYPSGDAQERDVFDLLNLALEVKNLHLQSDINVEKAQLVIRNGMSYPGRSVLCRRIAFWALVSDKPLYIKLSADYTTAQKVLEAQKAEINLLSSSNLKVLLTAIVADDFAMSLRFKGTPGERKTKAENLRDAIINLPESAEALTNNLKQHLLSIEEQILKDEISNLIKDNKSAEILTRAKSIANDTSKMLKEISEKINKGPSDSWAGKVNTLFSILGRLEILLFNKIDQLKSEKIENKDLSDAHQSVKEIRDNARSICFDVAKKNSGTLDGDLLVINWINTDLNAGGNIDSDAMGLLLAIRNARHSDKAPLRGYNPGPETFLQAASLLARHRIRESAKIEDIEMAQGDFESDIIIYCGEVQLPSKVLKRYSEIIEEVIIRKHKVLNNKDASEADIKEGSKEPMLKIIQAIVSPK